MSRVDLPATCQSQGAHDISKEDEQPAHVLQEYGIFYVTVTHTMDCTKL